MAKEFLKDYQNKWHKKKEFKEREFEIYEKILRSKKE